MFLCGPNKNETRQKGESFLRSLVGELNRSEKDEIESSAVPSDQSHSVVQPRLEEYKFQ